MKDEILSDFWLTKALEDWAVYLKEAAREEDMIKFRKPEKTGRPLSNEEFIFKIEKSQAEI